VTDADHPSIRTAAVAEGFSAGADEYDEVLRHNAEGAERLVSALPVGAWADVLDVGCGTGFASLAMQRRFGPRRIVGVDPSEGMLQVFAQKVAEGGDTAVELHAADVMAMPVPDASVDAVISGMAFHWFPDKPGALREMARCLRPGGVLGILCSGAGTDREFEAVLRDIRPPVPAAWVDVFGIIHRDLRTMRRDLLAAGLRIEDLWMEERVRVVPPERYLARIRLVAAHLSAGMDPAEAEAHGARVAEAAERAAGPEGFEYTFDKLFAIARRPA
jgi:SAM-dependent methyltransferase